MTEEIMNQIENAMLFEVAADPVEQDPDEALDFQRADELRAEMFDIGRLLSKTSEIEKLTKGLLDSVKRQAE